LLPEVKIYCLPKFTTGVDSDMSGLQGNLCVEYLLPQGNIIQGQGNTLSVGCKYVITSKVVH